MLPTDCIRYITDIIVLLFILACMMYQQCYHQYVTDCIVSHFVTLAWMFLDNLLTMLATDSVKWVHD